jgi:tetratricopeptide (TPR) repeat protein
MPSQNFRYKSGRSRRRAWLGAGLLFLPLHLGCLTAFQNTDAVVPDGSSKSKASRPELSSAASAKLNLTMAQVMEKSGHPAEAIFHYEKARQSDPSLHVAARLARLYDRAGDGNRALAEYQQAVKEDPKDAETLTSLGYFHYNRGEWAQAEENLRHALTLNPKLSRAWVNLGLTLGEQGQYPQSLEAFRKAVSEAEAHSNLAFIYTTQGKREDAKQEYRRALELNPNLPIARRALDKLEHPGSATGKDCAGGVCPTATEHAEPVFTAAQSRSPTPRPDLSPITVEGPWSQSTESKTP